MKLIVFLIILICNGCCCVNDRPDFKPLPPEKLHNLRFICGGWAYKSVTKKDYEEKDEYNETVLDES